MKAENLELSNVLSFTNIFHRKRQILGTNEMIQTRNSRMTMWLVNFVRWRDLCPLTEKLLTIYMQVHLIFQDKSDFKIQ